MSQYMIALQCRVEKAYFCYTIKNGLDKSYEAGVWTCDPVIVKDVCGFVNKLVVA